jgi:uncharacterized protein YjbJ (UPF0337 family)
MGAVDTVEGSVKQGVGKLTGDLQLETKGTIQKVLGKVQDGLGDVQDRGRSQPMLMWAVGAVIVVLVVGLLTGLVRRD